MARQREYNHEGNTPAMWTGVSMVMLAFLVGGVGVAMNHAWMFWLAVGIAALGVVVGYVMALMGFGQPRAEHGHDAGESAAVSP